ncbi:MAG: hypothetical protein AAGA62_03415 [Bacteroidota bacterium]
MSQARQYYQALSAAQQQIARAEQKRFERLSIVRLFLILTWVAALIFLFSTVSLIGLCCLLISLPLVAWGVRWHQAIGQRARDAATRAALAEGELAALSHDFSRFADGAAFLDGQHPYALDLDIFGPHSLFQFLNRTVTAPGQEKLASALLIPKTATDRARTQVQSKELMSQPDWLIEFRTIGQELKDDPAYFTRLQTWLSRPPVVAGRWDRLILLLAPYLGVAAILFILLVGPWYVGALGFIPTVWMLRKYAEIIPREHTYTAEMGKLLRGYAALLTHIGNRPEGEPALEAVPALKTLAYRISQLDVRYNAFVMLLEVGGLWSLQWLHKLDQWREQHAVDLPRWLDLLAEMDEMVSWATLRFNQASWVDPEFTEVPEISARELGHPLLNPNGRVANDLAMRTDGHIHLVTGSNMAGKSTWLRTVGVNLVLAQAGAPVCAQHLRTRPLQVWTSMRTQDDLSESTSSFYAELKRLKAIIAAVNQGMRAQQEDPLPVFFLLDEILKGTNSRDRHTGSRALIRQLIREQGAGIIATHDLELAALEQEPGSQVENFAMEVQTDGDQLTFDYKLHPGVCQSFNATALMARMGIDIPEEEIRLHH